jgi:PAS domain-containing protein
MERFACSTRGKREDWGCLAFTILITDAEGVIREANRAAAILLNVPQHELVGKPPLVFIAAPERHTFHTELQQLLHRGWVEEWGNPATTPEAGAL